MAKKTKAKLSVAENSEKGKEPNEEIRGKVVEVGVPLWQQNGRKRHLQFKAGKMYVIGKMVYPDPRKGYISIEQDVDHLMHFCWTERDGLGTQEEDLTPEPYDSIFKRVTKCTTGRVYILKIKSVNLNFFFWMQEASAEKDAELSAKINYLLNFPPAWMRFPQIACNFKVSRSPSQSSEYESAESMFDEKDGIIGDEKINEMEDKSGTQYVPVPLKRGRNDYLEPGNLVESLRDFLQAHEVKISRGIQAPGHIFSAVLSPSLDLSHVIASDSMKPIVENVDSNQKMEDLLPILEDGPRDGFDKFVNSKSYTDEMQAFSVAVKNEKVVQILPNLNSIESSGFSSDSEYLDVVDSEGLEHLVSKLTEANNKKASLHEKTLLSMGSEPRILNPTQHDGSAGIENYSLDKWESVTEPNFDPHQKTGEAPRSTPVGEIRRENKPLREDSRVAGRRVPFVETWLSARSSKASSHESKSLINSERSSQEIILGSCCVGSEGTSWHSIMEINQQSEESTTEETVMEKNILYGEVLTNSKQVTSLVDSETFIHSSSSKGSLWVSAANSSTDADLKSKYAKAIQPPLVVAGNYFQTYQQSSKTDERLQIATSLCESVGKYTDIEQSSEKTKDHRGDTSALRVDVNNEGIISKHREVGETIDVDEGKGECEVEHIAGSVGPVARWENECASKFKAKDMSEHPVLGHELHEFQEVLGVNRSDTEELPTVIQETPFEAPVLPFPIESTAAQSLTLKVNLKGEGEILEQPGCPNSRNLSLKSHGLDLLSRETILTTLTSLATFTSSSESRVADDESTSKNLQEHSESEENHMKNCVIAEGSSLQDNGSNSASIAMMVLVPSDSSDNLDEDVKRARKVTSTKSNNFSSIPARGTDNRKHAKQTPTSRGTVASSGGGTESTRADNHYLKTQKERNLSAEAFEGMTSVEQSKSLEDVIFVSGPQKGERYNLRKRPPQKLVPSQSGPAISVEVVQGRRDGSNKRPRMVSPGVPAPEPFEVPGASSLRSSRLRHPQVSGSASLLNSPNQDDEGNGQSSCKRPKEGELDEEPEAPPAKKVKMSDRSSSSAIRSSIKSSDLNSTSTSSKIQNRPGGSSSPGNTSLNSTVKQTSSSDSSRSTDTSPRYNLRRRSAKIEDGQQTEPVKIREIRKAGPETILRTRTVPQEPPGPPVSRANRDRSQNTRPVIVEDRNSSKSKSKHITTSDSNRRPKP